MESSQMNMKQVKRQWTRLEDGKLVECLVELAATSYKCDNGTFKSGYAKQLEKMINEKLSACGLKANPHIESRVKVLKKQYCAIVEMMGPLASGFGWNDTEKKIIVEKEIYDEWCKSHPNAKGLYNKTFPHFEELTGVFGKDRAQGANVEDPDEAVAAMEAELETRVNDIHENVGHAPNLDDIEVEAKVDSQVPQTSVGASSMSTQSRKRKRANQGASNEVLETLKDTITEIKTSYAQQTEAVTKQSESLNEMVSFFKHEKDVADQRKKLFALLNGVDGLTIEEMNKALLIIGTDPMLCDIVFSLP